MAACSSQPIGPLHSMEHRMRSELSLLRRAGSDCRMRDAWRAFSVADLKPEILQCTTPSEHVLFSNKHWPLPSLACWNARSVLPRQTRSAQIKLRVLRRLLVQHDIVGVVESHITDLGEALREINCTTHKGFLSAGTAASGGRLASLKLVHDGILRHYVFAHITPCHEHTWLGLVDLLAHETSETDHFICVVGDINLSTDSLRIDPTGTPIVIEGPRLAQWRAIISLWELPVGLTRINTADQTLTGIDKCFLNITEIACELLGLQARTVGPPHRPPGESDHWRPGDWPISIRAERVAVADSFPRWTFQHASYKFAATHWANILSLGESSSLGDLYSCIDSAVADVRNDLDQFGDDPFVQQGAIVATLYATMTGDRGRLQSLISRGTSWGLGWTWSLPRMARQLMPLLSSANRRVRQVLESEHSHAYPEESQHGSWSQLMHSLWKHLGQALAFSIGLEEEELLSTPDEAQALCEYWRGVFDIVEPPLRDTPLLDHIVALPWASVELDAGTLSQALCATHSTSPGPDGITFGHLKPIAEAVGLSSQSKLDRLCFRIALPRSFPRLSTVHSLLQPLFAFIKHNM
eukprot:5891985-Amphidinium_carterae.1